MRIHVYVRGLNHPLTFTGDQNTLINRMGTTVEIIGGTIRDASGREVDRAVFERPSLVGVVECED